MIVTYRRTGGLFLLFTLAAGALVATVVTVAAAAVVLTVAAAGGAAVLLVRRLLPRSWRGRAVPSATPEPGEIIEAQVVHAAENEGMTQQ
jgi:hypothetical protein